MNDDNRQLLELYAAFEVGSVNSTDLRSRIVAMLTLDSEEQAFRVAACDERDSICIAKEAKKLFECHGYKRIDWLDILRIYAVSVSKLILLGKVTEEMGADLIAAASQLKRLPDDFHELDTFRYAASEFRDRANEADMFRRGIRKEALRFAEKDVCRLAFHQEP